jgi:hypothetical protein
MKRLIWGAAAAIFGLGLTAAQACPGVASTSTSTTVAQPSDPIVTDISSAKKKKKKTKSSGKGGGASPAGTGGGAGGEAGSGGTTDRPKTRGNPAAPAR